MANAMFAVALAFSMRHFGTYQLGWADDTFLAGFLRVTFPFSAGVLIYRFNDGATRKSTWLANLIPFLLVPLFALNPEHLVRYGLFCIVVAFPVLLLLGARYQPPSDRFCRFLGDVSYPLYVIHVPLLRITEWVLAANGVAPDAGGPVGGLALIAALMGISWLLAKTYDPVARAWLGSKLLPLAGVQRRPA